MADTPNTTTAEGVEGLTQILAIDKLAFRNVLDLFFAALRADWIVFERRADPDSAEGRDLGHQAASVWAATIDALWHLHDMGTAHPALRMASAELLKIEPERVPDRRAVTSCGTALLKLTRATKGGDAGISDMLREAFALTEAYAGNLALMKMTRKG